MINTTRHRTAGAALIAGALAGLVTMAFHPTGQDVVSNATSGGHNVLAVGVHVLAMAGVPVLVAGLLALTALLARTRESLAYAGFVLYVMASVAVLIAAVASGLISPSLAAGLADADDATRAIIHSQMHYTGDVNQAFAKVYVVASAAAILLWSVAMLRTPVFSRLLAWWGILVGVLLALGMASGHLTLGIHGFGLVMLAQATWLVATGVQLMRTPVDP
jgi:hypothetical protein